MSPKPHVVPSPPFTPASIFLMQQAWFRFYQELAGPSSESGLPLPPPAGVVVLRGRGLWPWGGGGRPSPEGRQSDWQSEGQGGRAELRGLHGRHRAQGHAHIHAVTHLGRGSLLAPHSTDARLSALPQATPTVPVVGVGRVRVVGRVQEVALVLLGGSRLVEQQLGVCWVLTPLHHHCRATSSSAAGREPGGMRRNHEETKSNTTICCGDKSAQEQQEELETELVVEVEWEWSMAGEVDVDELVLVPSSVVFLKKLCCRA
ncbi:hypothetical protein F7725_018926 [Dissostichus mawsoni]|uniref:Uncharacterized protein n=1 Tax=Dissostichus mawsoni TaxID=36200 RepID=A0A7J5XUP8_DISMA|nr:hypothetical protein F7725_018926 [Dissostichus mawsoni]